MKYSAVTILISFLYISSLVAQNNTDSLGNVMYSSRPYKEKIQAYILYVENFLLKNFDTVAEAGHKGIELARKNGDSISVAELKRRLGTAQYFTGNYDLAAKNYYEAVAILERSSEKKKLALVYNEIAKLLSQNKRPGPRITEL